MRGLSVLFCLFLVAVHGSADDAAVRRDIVEWGKWAVKNKHGYHYAQIRPFKLTTRLPWTGDCSAFVTWAYKQAGAPDPNGLGYSGNGYTGTLLSHGHIISNSELKPGDVIVYGAGTGEHAAIIMEPGPDPMTISHGHEGDPSFVRVSWDGRHPQRLLRFATNRALAGGPPPGVAPERPAPAPPRVTTKPTPPKTKPHPAPAPPKENPKPAQPAPHPAPAATTPGTEGAPKDSVHGIDVSGFQHPNNAAIDWHAVKRSGQSFAFIKSTEGTTFVNSFYAADVRAAREAGLYVAAYHFARPKLPIAESAKAQAKFMHKTIGNVTGAKDLPPALDLEANEGLSAHQVGEWALAFLEELERLTGRTPILYTGFFFWRDSAGSPNTARFPLWEAWYTNAAAPPQVPSVYKGRWTFWQHTSTSRVPGIVGNVDGNRFCCSLESLDQLSRMRIVGQAQAPPPPPPQQQPPQQPPHQQPQQPAHENGTPAKCTTTEVHIRSQPGVSSTIVATSAVGEVFLVDSTIAAVQRDGYTWHKVSHCGGGVSGYMAFQGGWQRDCVCQGGQGAAHPPRPKRQQQQQQQQQQQPAHAHHRAGEVAHPPPPAQQQHHNDAAEVARWKEVIRRIAPSAAGWIVDGLAAAMPQMVQKFALNTVNRQAFFLAQTAEESAGFSTTVEFASGWEYEGRADLGNTHRGDGPRYKGRGIIQLTGRSNYGTYGRILGVDFVGNPDLAAKFPWAAETAGEYWKQRDINSCADQKNFICATLRINGGTNGESTREMYLGRARQALGGKAIVRAGAATTDTTGNNAASSFPPWAIGAIVGAVLMLVAIAVIIIIATQRRRKQRSPWAPAPLEPTPVNRASIISNEFTPTSNSGTIPTMRRK